MASDSTLLGAAGEHLIMCELLRRGYIAALAPQGVPNVDIVVTDVSGQQLCSIQVKSRRDKGRDGGWHMRPKHEGMNNNRLFYCFVDFGKNLGNRPEIFVMPSKVVADALRLSHQAWLGNPGMRGQKRKDSSVRRLLPDYGYAYRPKPNPYPLGWMTPYTNAWQLLELG